MQITQDNFKNVNIYLHLFCVSYTFAPNAKKVIKDVSCRQEVLKHAHGTKNKAKGHVR